MTLFPSIGFPDTSYPWTRFRAAAALSTLSRVRPGVRFRKGAAGGVASGRAVHRREGPAGVPQGYKAPAHSHEASLSTKEELHTNLLPASPFDL